MKGETPRAVPQVTSPMGVYWQQPPRDLILLDDACALMARAAFEQLQDCTGKRPENGFAGQMWKSVFRGKWFLHWYEPDVLHPERLAVQFREIYTVG